MTAATFDDLVRTITGDQPPRIWSLLVTVFGDLAQAEGATISGALLGQITASIGVKPEATRVALHRLRKEGWLDSKRNGRNSSYFLTQAGRELSAKATPRIYASEPEHKQVWLVMAETSQSDELEFLAGAWVSPSMVITGRSTENPDLFKTPLSPDSKPPHWMAAKVCDTETLALSQDVERALMELKIQMGKPSSMNALERTVLRILIIHSWRRVVLKVPALPDFVFPDGWAGAECRRLMNDLLDRLGKADLGDLEGEIGN